MQTNEKRPLFDWLIFTLIHAVIIGGISVVGFYVYSTHGIWLAIWVATSAVVAGLAATYLFAKDIPGEVGMKCVLYLFVAANAAYMAHNGARQIGVNSYNDAQVRKYEAGMSAAGKSTSRRIARELGLSAENASKLDKVFGDGVSTTVALLAFLEIGVALIIFAVASHRGHAQPAIVAQPVASWVPDDLDVKPTRALTGIEPGKDPNR